MIVRKMENPVFHKRKRTSLPGRDIEDQAINQEKGFDQHLLEAFSGEVVQKGNLFSTKVTPLTRDNLIRLGQI